MLVGDNYDNYNVGRLKYDRPDVMIGEEAPAPPHVATCLDFARPEVRQERSFEPALAADRQRVGAAARAGGPGYLRHEIESTTRWLKRKPAPVPTHRKETSPGRWPKGIQRRYRCLWATLLNAGRRDGELQQVTLGLRIVGACPEDRYSFRLNDSELAREDAKISTCDGGIVVYFPVKVGMPQRIETHHWFEFDLPIGLLQASPTVKNPHVSNAERCPSSIDPAFSYVSDTFTNFCIERNSRGGSI